MELFVKQFTWVNLNPEPLPALPSNLVTNTELALTKAELQATVTNVAAEIGANLITEVQKEQLINNAITANIAQTSAELLAAQSVMFGQLSTQIGVVATTIDAVDSKVATVNALTNTVNARLGDSIALTADKFAGVDTKIGTVEGSVTNLGSTVTGIATDVSGIIVVNDDQNNVLRQLVLSATNVRDVLDTMLQSI